MQRFKSTEQTQDPSPLTPSSTVNSILVDTNFPRIPIV